MKRHKDVVDRSITFESMKDLLSGLEHGRRVVDDDKFRLAATRADILTQTIFAQEILQTTNAEINVRRIKITGDAEIVVLPSYEEFTSNHSLSAHVFQEVRDQYKDRVTSAPGSSFTKIYDKAVRSLFKRQTVTRPRGVVLEEFEAAYPELHDESAASVSMQGDEQAEDRVPVEHTNQRERETQKAPDDFHIEFKKDELSAVYDMLMSEIRTGSFKESGTAQMSHDVLNSLTEALEVKNETLEMVDDLQNFIFAMLRAIDKAFEDEAELVDLEIKGTADAAPWNAVTRATIHKLQELDNTASPESAANDWVGVLADFNRFNVYTQALTQTMRDAWRTTVDISVAQKDVEEAWAKFGRIWRNTRFSFIAIVLQFEHMFPFLRDASTKPTPGEVNDGATIRRVITRVDDMLQAMEQSAEQSKRSDHDRWYTFKPVDEHAEFEEFLTRGKHRNQLRAILKSHGIKYERKSTWRESAVYHIHKVVDAIKSAAYTVGRVISFIHRNRAIAIGGSLLIFTVFYGVTGLWTGGYTSMDNPFLKTLFWTLKTLCNAVQTQDTQWITGSFGVWLMYAFFKFAFGLAKAFFSLLKCWKTLAAVPTKAVDTLLSCCTSHKQRRDWVETFKRTGEFPNTCCGVKVMTMMSTEDQLEHLARESQKAAGDFDFAFEWNDAEARRSVEHEYGRDDDIPFEYKKRWCDNLPNACSNCTRLYATKLKRYMDCSAATATARTSCARFTEKSTHVAFGLLGFFSRTSLAVFFTNFWKTFAKYFCTLISEANAIMGGVDADASTFKSLSQLAGTAVVRTVQNTEALAAATTKGIYASFVSVMGYGVDIHSNTGVLAFITRQAATVTAVVAGDIPGKMAGIAKAGVEYYAPGAIAFARDRDERLRKHDKTSAQIDDPSALGEHAVFSSNNDVVDVINAREKRTRVRVRETSRLQRENGIDDVPAALDQPLDSVLTALPPSLHRTWKVANTYLDSVSFQERVNILDSDAPPNTLERISMVIKDDPDFRALITGQAYAHGIFRDAPQHIAAGPAPVVPNAIPVATREPGYFKSGWNWMTGSTPTDAPVEVTDGADDDFVEVVDEDEDSGAAATNLTPPEQQMKDNIEQLLPDKPTQSMAGMFSGPGNSWDRFSNMAMRLLFSSSEIDAETARAARQFLFHDSEFTQTFMGVLAESFVEGEFVSMSTTYAGAEDTGTLYIYDTNGVLVGRIPRGAVRVNRAWGTKLFAALEAMDEYTHKHFTDVFGDDLDSLAHGPTSSLITGFLDAIAQDDPTVFNTSPNTETSSSASIFGDLSRQRFSFADDAPSKISALDCKTANIFCAASNDMLVKHSLFKNLAKRGIFVLDEQGLRDAIQGSTTSGLSLLEQGIILKQIDAVTTKHLPPSSLKAEVIFEFLMQVRQEGRFVVLKDGSWSSWSYTKVTQLGYDLDIATANAVNILDDGIKHWDPNLIEHIYEVPQPERMTKTQRAVYAANEMLRRTMGGRTDPLPEDIDMWHLAYWTHLLGYVFDTLAMALGLPITMLHVLRENRPSWVSGSAYTIKEIIGLLELLYQAVYGRKDMFQTHRRLRKFSVMARFFWQLDNKMVPGFRSIRARFGTIGETMLQEMIQYTQHEIHLQDIIEWTAPDNIQTLGDEEYAKINNAVDRMILHNPDTPGLVQVAIAIVAENERRETAPRTRRPILGNSTRVIAAAFAAVTKPLPKKTYRTAFPPYIRFTTQELYDLIEMLKARIRVSHTPNANDAKSVAATEKVYAERLAHPGMTPTE